jgi:branched-chain amino acid transport system permease protein
MMYALTVPALIQATSAGILLGGLFALTALGLSMVLGVMRLVNLVHGELVIIGAYLASTLLDRAGIDPLLSLPMVALAVGALAYPVQRLLLQPLARRGEQGALLTTFALSVIAQNLLIMAFTGNTRSIDRPYTRSNVDIGGVTLPTVYLIAFAISVVVSLALQLLVTRSSFGRRLRAAAEDAEAAQVLGVRVARVHAVTYALGGAVAGLSGALVGMAFSFTPTAGTQYLLTGFAVVVLGGLGSVKGTIIGGIVLGVAESWGALVAGDGYRLLIGLLVFLMLLAARPQGLFGRPV